MVTRHVRYGLQRTVLGNCGSKYQETLGTVMLLYRARKPYKDSLSYGSPHGYVNNSPQYKTLPNVCIYCNMSLCVTTFSRVRIDLLGYLGTGKRVG